MSRIVSQSLFETVTTKDSWRSQMTSLVVHAGLICLAFAITFPVIRNSRKPEERVVLIAPIIPEYKPKIEPLHRTEKLHVIARTPVVIAPVIIPPVVKVPEVKQAETPAVTKLEAPAPPKPAKAAEAAKLAPIVPKLAVGGFGDPNAVHAAESSRPAPVVMAKVGAFESPEGSGASGSTGHNALGGVKQTSFGSAVASNAPATGRGQVAVSTGNFGEGIPNGSAAGNRANGGVKSSGFGDTIAPPPQPKLVQTMAAAFTPVEILYKPRPDYSTEARNMRVEGQVSLEVVFQASGAVKVVRVIRGLGHGLDEAAQRAALQVKFKPATKAGVAVDQSATISITFELT